VAVKQLLPVASARSLGALPKLNVYVDETGDRGFTAKSSPHFAMTALMVPEEDDWRTRATAAGLRGLIDTPGPLHWVEHFKAKRPERRTHAATLLAEMRTAKVVHVIADKATCGLTRDGAIFYNYTTRLLLERVALAAQEWSGGSRLAIVRLGTVKGMDHAGTAQYLDHVRHGGCTTFDVPWQYIKWPPNWQNTTYDGIQLADIHAGMLNVALSGKPEDPKCAGDLLLCKHLLRRSTGGSLLGYGVKVIGQSSFVTGRVWYRDWQAL
jgi:hypothetical protein